MGECPLCGESTNKPSTRLIKESCGHSKCRLCLLNEESGCSVCEGSSADTSLNTIESIGNFDYRLPATILPNLEELDTSPRKLDFNKIPDAFNDCHLVERLTIDNSIAQDSNNVAKAPGPLKVDISTETEDIVDEEEEEEEVPPQPPLSVQRNTHSSLPPQVTQTPTQPVQPIQPKIPEVFANTVRNNHIAQPETSIVQTSVQNTVQNSFIPVTQRADGRQFITIAFIANNSPNKNQQIVTTPILNQCLPTIGNMATVQRQGGNQCIPVIGNLNALQNTAGSQFIIRNSNIVQNLMGNQSIPIIGNMNAMQNLTGAPPLTMIGNVNAPKNIAANQPLPSFATVNALQPQAKNQSFTTTGNQNVVQNVNALQPQVKGQSFSTGNTNVVQNVVGNQPYQATQAVPKVVEKQPAPAQETVNTPRKQTRTRGLPRIKTVKNVNIVQKSLPNQSDNVSSKVEKSPGKGRRQRKELPVYLVPRKPNEKAKCVPAQSPTRLLGCMSPEYKLEDYLLFNKQQNTNDAVTVVRAMQTETKVTNHTQLLNKPSESVINESPIVSDQYNCTVMQEKIVGNKVHVSEQQGQVPNDVSKDEKNIEGLGTKTAQSNENQDLNVIFNIRDENQTLNEEFGDEKEKLKIPNGDCSSKEEYQNLDALFDIIEKESKKLNGGIFDKEVKDDLNGGKQADMPDLHGNLEDEEDANTVLDQAVDIEEGKGQDLNNETGLNHQNKEIETLNDKIVDDKETSENLLEMNHEQEQSVIEKLPVENSAMLPLDEEIKNQEERQNLSGTEMECEEQEIKTLKETEECQNLNGEVLGDSADSPCINDEVDNKEASQTLIEEVCERKEDTNLNGELCHEKEENHVIEKEKDESQFTDEEKEKNQCIEEEKEENQCIEKEIPCKEHSNSHNENESNDDKVDSQYKNDDNKEKTSQMIYEDISDVENNSGESNSETPELQAISGESNDGEASCQCSDENSVDEVLNNEVDDQDETIETHQEENASSPSDVIDEPSPPFETNDPDVAHENEQSDVEENSRESSEKSLPDEPPSKSVRTLPTFKRPDEQENDLSEKLSDMHVEHEEDENTYASETNDREESQMLETAGDGNDGDQTHEGEEVESLQASFNANLTLTETKESEEKIPDSVTEDTQPIVKKRGRKKKSFSDYELDCKPKASSKNQQPGVKKPRGRPKKSLSNLERPNDQQLDEESQVQDESVQSQESSRLEVHDENSETAHGNEQMVVVKKPRGRPKTKNVLPTFVPPAKVPLVNDQPIVKKPRGRPKKSLSNLEQSNVASEAELSMTTESSVLADKTSHEEVNEPQLDDENERVPAAEDSRVDMEQQEQESLHSTVNANDEHPVVMKKPRGRPKKSLSSGEQPTIVKKPRGRPKKSLSNIEQPLERDPSQEQEQPIEHDPSQEKEQPIERDSSQEKEQPIERDSSQEKEGGIATGIDDEEDKGQQSESEENQVLDREVLEQDETSQNTSVDMDHEEQRLHPKVDEDDTVTESSDPQPDTVHEDEQKSEAELETEHPVASEIVDEESQDQHYDERSENEESQVLAQDETSQHSSVAVNYEERESLHSETTMDMVLADKVDSETNEESNAAQELPVVEKKPRGRPRKSLSVESAVSDVQPEVEMNDEEQESLHSNINTDTTVDLDAAKKSDNEEPIVVKKARGRPKKSLSSCDRESESAVSDTKVLAAGEESNIADELSVVAKKSRGRPKKSLSTESTMSDLRLEVETNDEEQESPQPNIDTDKKSNTVNEKEESIIVKKPRGRPKKSLSSCDRESESAVDDTNVQPEVQKIDEESLQPNVTFNDSVVSVKKPRGRPKKSLSSGETPSQPEVNDANAVVVKKPRGRPKKSLSSLEQADVPSEAEIPVATEPSVIGEKTNDEEDEVQHPEVEENEVLGREVLDQDETSQNPSIAADGEERESLQSEVTPSLNFTDKIDSEVGEKSSAADEHPVVVKKPRGRPKKSLSNCEQQSQPETHEENAVVVKKPRGRPKKSLSNLEQPTERDPSPEKEQPAEATVSDVCDENNEEEDQIQCLNGAVDDEESQIVDDDVGDLGDTQETANASVHTEQDETLDAETEVNEPCNENPVDDQLDNTHESEQLVKKGRGRPKKVEVKKPRGRPKKSSYEQNPDESIQVEMTREDHHLQDVEERNEEIDNQERTNDVSSNLISTLDQESVEVPEHEEESPISQEEESQDSKVQDDENKENKEKYSEEDEVKAEHESSTAEQDSDKTPKEDSEVAKNNTTGRKYKSFDKINTQLIVENGKRKRKPKVLLYENEDLEISTSKKRKKEASALPRKNGSRKSFDKTPTDTDKSPLASEQVVKVKKPILKSPVQEIPPTDSTEKFEEPVKNESLSIADENSMDTITSDFSHNDDEKPGTKRQRRPKILLYENEDLTITPKSIKKKKVEFSLPTNEESMDSSHVEFAELPTFAKKTERVRKPKPASSRKRHVKFQLSKEDLMLLKQFNIKLEPVVILDRLTDLSFITNSKKSKPRKPRKEPSVLANKIRGRPKKTCFSHIKKLSDNPPLYECKICNESFRTYSIRKFHAACAITTYRCQYCPRQFSKDSHRQFHERGHTGDKPFGCDLCGRKFEMKYKLNRHMNIHKCMPDLECNECGRKFMAKENLKSHLLSHVQSSFVFACNHCPKSFSLDSNRKRHELSHSAVALFKCLLCPKSFKTKFDVTRHVKTHQKLRPFACHDCGKSFLTKFEVRRHAVTHSEDKEYTCNYCEKHFGRYDNYARHMRHHHPEVDPMSVRTSANINGRTHEADEEPSSSERKKEQSAVKPKKISRSASNSTPTPISFSESLTPQPAPAPYSISQNHDLASVIRETLPDLNNAVPVISVAPISAVPSSSLMDPIPLEQALVINRQIEEKMYAQSSFCEFPGLTRRNVTIVSRRASYNYERRSSSGSNSNSNDGSSFLTMNQERFIQQQDEEEVNATKKDIHVHWRRRTAETFKSKMDQND